MCLNSGGCIAVGTHSCAAEWRVLHSSLKDESTYRPRVRMPFSKQSVYLQTSRLQDINTFLFVFLRHTFLSQICFGFHYNFYGEGSRQRTPKPFTNIHVQSDLANNVLSLVIRKFKCNIEIDHINETSGKCAQILSIKLASFKVPFRSNLRHTAGHSRLYDKIQHLWNAHKW